MLLSLVVHLSPLSSIGVVQPRLSLLPPSTVEPGAGQRYTAVYGQRGASPRTGTLGWKVGGSGVSGGVVR
ncbi:hypothetical protein N1851_001685 [Merluccius polli]|uniref:Uncharacterized protein n=1 Tax=Merluccius polli TaxID=89951 RepID=A0AA47NCQ5_MERPO|nr:hypothetical protein N1851_001685 [Merluccius polli]